MSADKSPTRSADDENVETIAVGIEQTRAQMSATLGAIEQKLSPADLAQKARGEIDHVEERVKVLVKEGLGEAKGLVEGQIVAAKGMLEEQIKAAKGAVHEEIGEAKVAVNEQLVVVKDLVSNGLAEARDALKEDIRTAIATTKRGVRDATIGRVEDIATQAGDFMNQTRDTLIDTVRQNPLPAALAGIGIAWLLMNRSSSARRAQLASPYASGGYDRYPQQGAGYGGGSPGVGQAVGRAVGTAQHAVGRAVGGAQHAVGDAARQVGGALDAAGDALSNAAHGATEAARNAIGHGVETASHVVDATGRIVEQAGEATGHFLHDASAAVGHVAHDAQHLATRQAARIGRGLESTLETNPLALGAAALAVGAAIGFALPRTQKEDELLGEIRDRALEGAAHTAQGVVESIQHLAADAREGAKDALGSASR